MLADIRPSHCEHCRAEFRPRVDGAGRKPRPLRVGPRGACGGAREGQPRNSSE